MASGVVPKEILYGNFSGTTNTSGSLVLLHNSNAIVIGVCVDVGDASSVFKLGKAGATQYLQVADESGNIRPNFDVSGKFAYLLF